MLQKQSMWQSFVILKRSLSGYHTQGNLPAYTKLFIGKNVLDIQQLQANQIDINSTVSSHLLGSPAQSCVKAWRTEPKRSRHCFPGRLWQATVGTAGGFDASSWPHRASLEARWEQACSVNSTSNLTL